MGIDTSFPHLNMSGHFAPDGHNVWYAEAVMELPVFARWEQLMNCPYRSR